MLSATPKMLKWIGTEDGKTKSGKRARHRARKVPTVTGDKTVVDVMAPSSDAGQFGHYRRLRDENGLREIHRIPIAEHTHQHCPRYGKAFYQRCVRTYTTQSFVSSQKSREPVTGSRCCTRPIATRDGNLLVSVWLYSARFCEYLVCFH
jgi:hypothetical protein